MVERLRMFKRRLSKPDGSSRDHYMSSVHQERVATALTLSLLKSIPSGGPKCPTALLSDCIYFIPRLVSVVSWSITVPIPYIHAISIDPTSSRCCCCCCCGGTAMSSNPPSVATSSKGPAPSGSLSPAHNSPGAVATGDSYGQRRSGGSFGAGAATRTTPTPRNSQLSKKQHKGSKRFRQPDEDAIAESVSLPWRRVPITTLTSIAARNASLQQPEGPDVHHPPHEHQSPPAPAKPPLARPRKEHPEESGLGAGLGLSRH